MKTLVLAAVTAAPLAPPVRLPSASLASAPAVRAAATPIQAASVAAAPAALAAKRTHQDAARPTPALDELKAAAAESGGKASSGKLWSKDQLDEFLARNGDAIRAVAGVKSVEVFARPGMRTFPHLLITVANGYEAGAVKAAVEKAAPEVRKLGGVMGAPIQVRYTPDGAAAAAGAAASKALWDQVEELLEEKPGAPIQVGSLRGIEELRAFKDEFGARLAAVEGVEKVEVKDKMGTIQPARIEVAGRAGTNAADLRRAVEAAVPEVSRLAPGRIKYFGKAGAPPTRGGSWTKAQLQAFLSDHRAELLAVKGVKAVAVRERMGSKAIPHLLITTDPAEDPADVKARVETSVPAMRRLAAPAGVTRQVRYQPEGAAGA